MISGEKIIKGWEKFFFEEKPTEGLAIFRIFWIGLIFVYFLLDLNNIHDFYGPHAIISLNTVKSQYPYIHGNLFHIFGSDYNFVYTLLALYGIALVSSILGFYTKTSLIVVIICMTSFHQRNIWLLSSAEVLMRTITLILLFTPCGNSFSLDSLRSKGSPKNKPVWGLRLLQIQLAVVYLWTFWHKLKGDTWIDGSAVYYATRLESMTNFKIPYLMNSIWALKLATWGTLALELALGTLIWFKEFRKPLIFLGILFHLSIEYLMSIPFFELYMIVLLINFYTPEEFRFVINFVGKRWAELKISTIKFFGVNFR
jgi:hypothetical protein